MNALRIGFALCAVSLAGCDNLLGLDDIVPDGRPVALSMTSATTSVARQPLGEVVVSVVDARGMRVADFSGEVQLALGNNPGGATLLGTLAATATTGTARFDLVGIDRPGTGYTLVASTQGLPPATSNPIDVVAPPFTPVPTGLAGGPIAGIVVSPAPAGGTPAVFAGAGDGVYRSVDGGASWKSASFGGGAAGRLVADPSRPGVLYSWNFDSVLKKTVDGGAVWRDLASGEYVFAVAIDPKDPSVVYIAGGSGFRRSSDGGMSWTNLGWQFCQEIAVDPVTTDTLWCTAYSEQARQELVYKSSNGGASWRAVSTVPSAPYYPELVATPTGVFVNASGALYRSTDAGGSWTRVYAGYTYTLAYAPSMPSRIYLSVSTGIVVSSDGGASFGAPVSAGDFLGDLAVDPTNPDLVYGAGSRLGVLVSTDGGVSWSASSKGIDAHSITSLAMAPGAPGTVLTTIPGPGPGPAPATVLRTTSGGTSWDTVSPSGSQSDVTVHFDPAVSTRAYLCGHSYFATSTDSGASFTGGTVAGLGGPCPRLLIAGTTLFATGAGRLFKSTDGGARWADTGLGTMSYVFDAALGDATGNVVVASTTSGIQRSSNGGTSFTQVDDHFSYTLVSDPRMPTNIVAGDCPGFRLSSDGGASFRSPSTELCVHKLSAAGSALYAAGSDFEDTVLLRSTDGGATWAPIDITGVPSGAQVTSIAASDDGQTVYLGTSAGIYQGHGR
jgi:photosystem II stability/assembly factor-like uncharacterized protein